MKNQVEKIVKPGIYRDEKNNQLYGFGSNGWEMIKNDFTVVHPLTKNQAVRLGEIIYNSDCLTFLNFEKEEK